MKGYTLMNSPEFVPYSVLARWIIGGLVSLLAVATCAGGALNTDIITLTGSIPSGQDIFMVGLNLTYIAEE